MMLIASCAAFVAVVWFTGSVAWTLHFNKRFNEHFRLWEQARLSSDHEGMRLHLRCEELAHEDTGRAQLWFLHLNRWSADYIAEATRR